MRLYIEGHNHKHGYAVSREYSDAECSKLALVVADDLDPRRFVPCLRKAKRFVRLWNAMYATH